MELIKSLWQLIIALINPIILIPGVIVIAIFVWKNIEYKRGAYYQITKLSYFSMCRDTGRYGEYLTYKHLKSFEMEGARFLFNLYIPKGNGQTTEIDIVMICRQGVFVFESKNYSGWIFGNSKQKHWYQTLPAGRGKSHKESFYNPVMQNKSHIKHLQEYLGKQLPMYSIIVFSNRCLLRNVTFDPNEAIVVNREDVEIVVDEICQQVSPGMVSENNIEEIYSKLYPLTQVDANIKMQHIEDILYHQMPQTVPFAPQSVSMTGVSSEENQISSTVSCEHQEDHADPSPVINSFGANRELQKTDYVSAETKATICPKCGGILVQRTATRGANVGRQFYGCSNYPKCRYIKDIYNKE